MSENTPPTDQAVKEAFARALSKVRKVPKDADNPFFKSKYQSLDGIQEMLKPVLESEGLVYSQHVDYIPAEQSVSVQTILWDAFGASLNLGTTRLPVPKMTPQDAGSAFSYGKRYALGALFAIQTGEDTDAEDNMNRNGPARAVTPTPPSKPSPAPSAAKAREGTGWETGPNGPDKYVFLGREWEFSKMNVRQLGTVAYSADGGGMSKYPPDFIKLCNTELLKRVAAGDLESTQMVEANAPQ